MKRVQFIRGPSNQANAFTGLQGEITAVTDSPEIRLHDDLTPGGFRILGKTLTDTLYQAFSSLLGSIAGITGSGVIKVNSNGTAQSYGLTGTASVVSITDTGTAYQVNLTNPLNLTGYTINGGNFATPGSINGAGIAAGTVPISALQAAGQLFLVPSGGIILWHGSASSIPSGWVLCDGNNGTPNLVSAFVLGAHAGTENTGGGNANITLLASNLPSHSLTVTDPGHTHVLTDPTHSHTVGDPSHHHATSFTHLTGSGSTIVGGGGYDLVGGNTSDAVTGITIGGNTTGITMASHLTGVTVNYTNTPVPISTVPPYYALCYIMKL